MVPAARAHLGVATRHGGDSHHEPAHGLHSSFDSHSAFGLHQEPFHGLHVTHHDSHHGLLHHDDHYLGPFAPWAWYPRIGYSTAYYDTYSAPMPYTTPTVVVMDTNPTPVPAEPAAAPELAPGESSSAPPRDEHRADGPARLLRAPLVETSEAPEVLPPPALERKGK
ncbi:MAG: hypothetical protein WAT39_10210 [Planctomycetota bacterium]